MNWTTSEWTSSSTPSYFYTGSDDNIVKKIFDSILEKKVDPIKEFEPTCFDIKDLWL